MPTRTVILRVSSDNWKTLFPSAASTLKPLSSPGAPPEQSVSHAGRREECGPQANPSVSQHLPPNPSFDLVTTMKLPAKHNRRTGHGLLSGYKMIVITSGPVPGTSNPQREPRRSFTSHPHLRGHDSLSSPRTSQARGKAIKIPGDKSNHQRQQQKVCRAESTRWEKKHWLRHQKSGCH